MPRKRLKLSAIFLAANLRDKLLSSRIRYFGKLSNRFALFHKQGVGAMSPDQAIEASETGKGQFYHYFKSKEGLVHEVLQTYLDDIAKGTAPLSYEIDSWEDLERWSFSNIELQKRFRMTRGCPFGTIGNEVTENDELIRQDLSLIFEVVKNKLAAFFIKEKAKGRLTQDANEEQMADFCIATVQGAMLLGKIKRNSRTVENDRAGGIGAPEVLRDCVPKLISDVEIFVTVGKLYARSSDQSVSLPEAKSSRSFNRSFVLRLLCCCGLNAQRDFSTSR